MISVIKKIKVARSMFETIVSARKPYGLAAETMVSTSKFGLPEFFNKPVAQGYKIFGLDKKMKRICKYLPKEYPIPKKSPCLYKYKVFICNVYGIKPSKLILGIPKELCTETFLEIGPFNTKLEAENAIKYIKTKFFRSLVDIVKNTHHAARSVYRYVPLLDFTNNSDIDWTKNVKDIDTQLFNKFKLNKDEIEFIENNVQEMD